MDPRGNIYEDDPEKIPADDKARLEGFLRGRAEADQQKRLKAEVERIRNERSSLPEPAPGDEEKRA